MACGDKYRNMIPQPPPGFDILDPDTWVITGWSAYADRKAAADRFAGYVQEAWNVYKDKAPAVDTYLEASVGEYFKRYQELPNSTWWDSTPDEQLVAMAQASAEDGTCMLERIETKLAKLDAGYESVPAQGTGGKGEGAGGLLLLLALGVGGYFLVKTRGGSE